MGSTLFYLGGSTKAVQHAAEILQSQGIAFTDDLEAEITDLLLDIPSFQKDLILRSGEPLSSVLGKLSPSLRIWGGKLRAVSSTYQTVDLLENPRYPAENGAITADCAIRLAGPKLQKCWGDCRVLVIGWGRIGKNLCRMLKRLGSSVTVCARKEPDRALLAAFGYQVLKPEDLRGDDFDLIFNTAPAPMMTEAQIGICPLAIDLAGCQGLQGKQVLSARGLPGIWAPETSGKLIARTILEQLGGGSGWISVLP